MAMKLAAQLYTLRDYCLTREDLFETLGRLKQMGYDGVEMEDIHKVCPPEEVAAYLKEIGLEVCCTRNKYGRCEYDLEGMIREAQLYGTAYMGVGTTSCEDSIYGGESGPLRYCRFMTDVAQKARQAGLSCVYELRSHEFLREEENGLAYLRQPGTLYLAQKLLRDTPADFRMSTDSWYIRCSSLTAREVLELVSGRCDIFRFRDHKIRLNELDFYRAHLDPCECGEGASDLAAWLPALEAAGVKWITLGQEFCTKDPFTCMQISLNNVRRILNCE